MPGIKTDSFFWADKIRYDWKNVFYYLLKNGCPQSIAMTLPAIKMAYDEAPDKFTPQLITTLLNNLYVAPNGRKLVAYRFIDDTLILLTPSYGIRERWLSYPQGLVQFGIQASGKSVTMFDLATDWLEKYGPNGGKVFVIGDLDYMTPGKSQKEIMKHYDWYIPDQEYWVRLDDEKLPPEVINPDPKDKTPILILYDEIVRGTHSKRSMSYEGVQSDISAYRQRHKAGGLWMIYNVIYPTSMQSSLRDSTALKLIRRLAPEQLYNLFDAIKIPFFQKVFSISTELVVDEAIAYYTPKDGGVRIEILRTNKPKWLAKKEKDSIDERIEDHPMPIIQEEKQETKRKPVNIDLEELKKAKENKKLLKDEKEKIKEAGGYTCMADYLKKKFKEGAEFIDFNPAFKERIISKQYVWDLFQEWIMEKSKKYAKKTSILTD